MTADQLASDKVIEPYDHHIASPSAWKFSSMDRDCTFQVLVFPRQHSLTLVHPSPSLEIAGSKRTRSSLEEPLEAPVAGQSAVIKRLHTVTETLDGDMVHVTTRNTQDYTLFRMRRVGDTRAAQVFQARHSAYSNQIVIVKAFKIGPHHNARSRGENWKREYGIHRTLLSVSVPLR